MRALYRVLYSNVGRNKRAQRAIGGKLNSIQSVYLHVLFNAVSICQYCEDMVRMSERSE